MSCNPLRAKKTLIQNMFSSGDAPPRTPPIQCCVVGGDRFRVRNKRSFPSVAHYSTNPNIELGGAGRSFLTICVLRGERFFSLGTEWKSAKLRIRSGTNTYAHVRTLCWAGWAGQSHFEPPLSQMRPLGSSPEPL